MILGIVISIPEFEPLAGSFFGTFYRGEVNSIVFFCLTKNYYYKKYFHYCIAIAIHDSL
jgi:hypothetical protein